MAKDEITQISNVGKLKPSSLNGLSLKIGLILGGLFILVVTFYSGLMIGKNFVKTPTNYSTSQSNQTPQSNQPTQQPVNQSVTSYIDQTIRIYPSLNGNFSFYIYPTDNGSKCLYGIRDKQGYGYDVSKILGTDRITCSEGQGNLSSSFMEWADGNKFLINEKEGEVKIIDVGKIEAETYKYDTGKYNFIGANRTLKYWLFRKISKGNPVSYILQDKNNNVALDNINFESNDRGVLYDEINDGFLFISRTFTVNIVSVKFDFLPMSNLSLRNILTTDPIEAPGRGCIPEYLISQPGEIILTPGCLSVSSKYHNPDGNIHIKL